MSNRIHALWPSAAALIGLVLIFVGERVYEADSGTRFGLAGIGTAALLLAVAWRAKEWSGASPDKKPVSAKMLLLTLGLAVSVILYALIPGVFHGDSTSSERIRGVLWAVWPIVWICSLLPLLSIEFATAPVAFIDRYEHGRVNRSFGRSLSLGLLLSCLFVANYLANRHDEKWDLSAGNKATASEVTQRAVRDLTKKVKVVLFFPRASEVAETVERYFEPLQRMNADLEVQVVDHALASDLAKETKVTENGYVAVMHDKASEKIRIGTKARTARSNLRRFDQNFIKALIKVTTSKKVAYFTLGHDERADRSPHKDDKRATVKLLRRQLEAWQFTIKKLGVAEGLATEIPDDAGIVFIMGPEKPFLDAEIDALKRYLDRGGRIFLALEAERDGDPMDGLLAGLGLKFSKVPLANERTNAPLTKTKADRAFIWSNKYSSHASVTTMTRNDKLATVFFKSGSLSKTNEKIERLATDLVLTAVADTFGDVNDNLEFDEATEKKERYGLAAAVTRTSTTGKKEAEGRAFVLADADVVSDDLIKLVKGNVLMMADIVYWLQLTKEPAIPTIEEKDVKMVHRKEDDTLLFYGTTFGVPILVMLLGFMQIRRRRA